MKNSVVHNPHSNLLRAGKVSTGTGLNGQHQPQSVGQKLVINPFANQGLRKPIKN